MSRRTKLAGVLGLLTGLVACKSSVDTDYSTLAPDDASDEAATTAPGGDGFSGTGGSGSGSGGSAALPAAATTLGLDLPSAGAAGAPSNPNLGQEEACDGIDDDSNGIIDDVDVGGDGVCDCLRIATIGAPGTWGVGDVFDAWLDSRSNNGAVDLGDTVLTADVLDQFQVVVAQDLSARAAFTQEEVDALEAWVRSGGGFMTLIGYTFSGEEVANVNELLASFGSSYETQQILQRQNAITIPVTNWETHPVTEGVSSLGVDNGYPVAGGTVLATEQGFDLLSAIDVDDGHVLVWGDEWITYDSEWTEHPDYQVELFWLNAIKWLTPATDCQVPIPIDVK